MGREARRVPPDWQHPINQERPTWPDGGTRYEPMFDGRSYERELREWAEGAVKWCDGLREGFEPGGEKWVPRLPDDGKAYEDWAGTAPLHQNYMPVFAEGTATHWQMYETCSEGTPISPVMASPEELARWLADTGASSFGSMTATYEAWLALIIDHPTPEGEPPVGVLMMVGPG